MLSKPTVNLLAAIIIAGAFVFVEHRYINPPPPGAKSNLAWGKDLKAAMSASEKSGKPVLVDFDATWCGPCQDYKTDVYTTPEFVAASQKYELVEIDIDDQPDVAKQYGVEAIPDIRLFNKKGTELQKLVGYQGLDLVADMEKNAAKP